MCVTNCKTLASTNCLGVSFLWDTVFNMENVKHKDLHKIVQDTCTKRRCGGATAAAIDTSLILSQLTLYLSQLTIQGITIHQLTDKDPVVDLHVIKYNKYIKYIFPQSSSHSHSAPVYVEIVRPLRRGFALMIMIMM